MIFRRLAALLASLFLVASVCQARELSDQASASLWTVGPGPELYAAFGHSALRITDPVLGFDRIYNFGTFDFATPNFYLKFMHGDLDYFLSAAIAPELVEEYRDHQQLVVEQQLNLTPDELDQLFISMEDNLQPEFAAYRYDFVRDNCTTRIRDAVARVTKVRWQPLEKSAPTLREMVQPYVADRPAIQTGINLLFGDNMDHPATAMEAMFLPEDMKIAFDRAIIEAPSGERPLIKSTQILLPGAKVPRPATNWLVLATYGAAVFALVSLLRSKGWPRWLDILIFSIVGLIGCALCFFWFGTRHWVLHENWNLLWAWPTHLLIWFLPKRVQRAYWFFYAAIVLFVATWLHFETVFLGMKLLLGFRALALARQVPGKGLEPSLLSKPDPKSGASANFATQAL